MILPYFLLINWPIALASAFTPESIISFADFLFENRDYYRAITEYERVIFMFPDDPLSQKAQLQIAMAYFMGEKWEVAIEHFQELATNYPNKELGKQSYFMVAETYYKKKDYQRAIESYKDFIVKYLDDPMCDEAHIRLGWSFLRINNAIQAEREFRSLSSSSSKKAETEKIAREVKNINDIHYKNPLLAALLSAILPGSGQLYAERPSDAITSFLLNGLFIGGMVESFENGNTIVGIILSGIEVGWYTGNIYNATNDAYKYNQRAKSNFIDNLEYKYDLSFTVTREEHKLFTIRIPF